MGALEITAILVLVLTGLLVLAAVAAPRVKGYRLVLQKKAPRKKRKTRAKKKKNLWIKVL